MKMHIILTYSPIEGSFEEDSTTPLGLFCGFWTFGGSFCEQKNSSIIRPA